MHSLRREKFLTDSELKQLEKSIQDKSRDSILIRLALETGARASELLALTGSDLDHETRSVYIRALKKSHDREVPLSQTMFEDLVGLARQSTRLFEISYQRLVQIWAYYRPCKKTFHSLRHTFAIQLYKKHRDLKLVQICLGHRSVNTTAIYADFVYRTEELRKILAR